MKQRGKQTRMGNISCDDVWMSRIADSAAAVFDAATAADAMSEINVFPVAERELALR